MHGIVSTLRCWKALGRSRSLAADSTDSAEIADLTEGSMELGAHPDLTILLVSAEADALEGSSLLFGLLVDPLACAFVGNEGDLAVF